MRHAKSTFKVGRTSSHRRCLLANALKSLVEHERIETTVAKAKELRRYADRLITLAKRDTLASKRRAIAKLMISFNPLSSKELTAVKRLAKEDSSLPYRDSQSPYGGDRKIIRKLFEDLAFRFVDRKGGYTRIIRKEQRVGDSAELCFLEFVR